jgi:hypothetical protein
MYQYPQYNAQATQQSNMIWVQGEAGAKSYLVAPNTTVQLWDSEDKKIYLKSADTTGMPSIKTLRYEVEENTPVNAPDAPKTDFATKDDILSLEKQIDELKGRFEKERNYERKPNANGSKLAK